jgi:hypothetical protein
MPIILLRAAFKLTIKVGISNGKLNTLDTKALLFAPLAMEELKVKIETLHKVNKANVTQYSQK